ncbi:MAG: 7TM-DISM domain-containing protein, partial [Nitrososphaeraceae archaeon]|nr:7TM-DISM domain-containing protein [Nitrososphaeraceae archaeon]
MNIEEVPWYDFVNIGFAGAMLLVFLYAFSVYLYDRKALSFYYGAYIFSVGLYLFSRSTLIYEYLTKDLEYYLPWVNNVVGYTFQYIAHFTALQFGVFFLNAKRYYPAFYKAARFTRVIFALAIIFSLINISIIESGKFSIWLLNIERIFATLMAIYFQVIILKNSRNKLVIFYVVGSIFFLTGAVISVFALNVIYMRIGTVIEVLFFALGLAYRSKIIQEERNLFKDKMMKETVEKEKLLNQYNEDLKNQVIQRS